MGRCQRNAARHAPTQSTAGVSVRHPPYPAAMTEQDGPVGDGPWTTEQARRLVAPDVLLRPLTGSRLRLSVCYRLESTSELVRAT